MTTKEQRMLKKLISTGMQETDLASLFHVHQVTIQRWLRGDTKPPYMARVRIAEFHERRKDLWKKKK